MQVSNINKFSNFLSELIKITLTTSFFLRMEEKKKENFAKLEFSLVKLVKISVKAFPLS